MSTIPLFVWPLGPVINTEPVRYVVNKVDHDRVVDTLREQNRVLRKALEDIVKADWAEPAGIAKAALTATSQPAPPYKEWCRHPEEYAGLASCPRNPTCAD